MKPGGPEWGGANGASGRPKACSGRCKRVLRTSISPPLHGFRALPRFPAPARPFQEPGIWRLPHFSLSSSVSISSVQFSYAMKPGGPEWGKRRLWAAQGVLRAVQSDAKESQIAGLVGVAVRECGAWQPIAVCSWTVGLRCKESPGVDLVGCGS